MKHGFSLSPTTFDEYAAEYEKDLQRGLRFSGEDKNYFARGRVAWLERRLTLRGVRPERVMDFGCGVGTSVPFLLGMSSKPEVVGVDVSSQSLEVARRSTGSTVASKVQFHLLSDFVPGGNFDLVFCNGVFHHIPVVERAAAVDFVWKSLKPGGLFALWENNPWNLGARLVMSLIPFDRDAIPLSFVETRRLLTAGGFSGCETDFLFIWPRILKFLRFTEHLFCCAPLGAQYMVLVQKK